MSEKELMELKNKLNELSYDEIKELAFMFLKTREKTRIRAMRHREKKKKEKMESKNN